MNCPICQNTSDRIFEKYGYWVCECKRCHHCFAEISTSIDHTNKIYQDEYFSGGAAGYPNYLSEERILISHGERYGRLLNTFTAPGTMLDVGTAAGFILKGFQKGGWHGIGLEPNSSMARYGRTHLGLHIEHGSLEEFSSPQQFDLVSMIQVIAHFFDIRQALQRAGEATKPGGFWLIETWDRESWVARRLGRHWYEYSPPSVLHWFSPAGLKLLVGQYGFSEVACGRPAKWISAAHAKSMLGYKLQTFRSGWLRHPLNIIPDQLAIPYPAFDLFWMLFRRSPNEDS
jgi:SAM-dependent methyltransferase